MDDPKCRLCGERHPLRGGCPSLQKSKPAKNPTAKPVPKTDASSKNSPSSRLTDAPPKPAFDRKTYQREYMRKYLPAYRKRKGNSP